MIYVLITLSLVLVKKDPLFVRCSRAKHPSVVAKAGKLRDMPDTISKIARLPSCSSVTVCQRKGKVLLLPTGEALA